MNLHARDRIGVNRQLASFADDDLGGCLQSCNADGKRTVFGRVDPGIDFLDLVFFNIILKGNSVKSDIFVTRETVFKVVFDHFVAFGRIVGSRQRNLESFVAEGDARRLDISEVSVCRPVRGVNGVIFLRRSPVFQIDGLTHHVFLQGNEVTGRVFVRGEFRSLGNADPHDFVCVVFTDLNRNTVLLAPDVVIDLTGSRFRFFHSVVRVCRGGGICLSQSDRFFVDGRPESNFVEEVVIGNFFAYGRRMTGVQNIRTGIKENQEFVVISPVRTLFASDMNAARFQINRFGFVDPVGGLVVRIKSVGNEGNVLLGDIRACTAQSRGEFTSRFDDDFAHARVRISRTVQLDRQTAQIAVVIIPGVSDRRGFQRGMCFACVYFDIFEQGVGKVFVCRRVVTNAFKILFGKEKEEFVVSDLDLRHGGHFQSFGRRIRHRPGDRVSFIVESPVQVSDIVPLDEGRFPGVIGELATVLDRDHFHLRRTVIRPHFQSDRSGSVKVIEFRSVLLRSLRKGNTRRIARPDRDVFHQFACGKPIARVAVYGRVAIVVSVKVEEQTSVSDLNFFHVDRSVAVRLRGFRFLPRSAVARRAVSVVLIGQVALLNVSGGVGRSGREYAPVENGQIFDLSKTVIRFGIQTDTVHFAPYVVINLTVVVPCGPERHVGVVVQIKENVVQHRHAGRRNIVRRVRSSPGRRIIGVAQEDDQTIIAGSVMKIRDCRFGKGFIRFYFGRRGGNAHDRRKDEREREQRAHKDLCQFFHFSPLSFLYFYAEEKSNGALFRRNGIVSAGNQPLIPIVETPSINCFWNTANSAAQGIIISTPTAIVRLMGSFDCPYFRYSARESVYCDSSSRYIRGPWKSFHTPKKVCTER